MKQISGVILILLGTAFCANAQQVWTLENCLDTAVANNPSIRQADLDGYLAEIDKQLAVAAFTPSASVSVGHSFNYGRILDPVSNQFTQSSRQNTNFNGFATLSLFEGMRRYYNLQRTDLLYKGVAYQKAIVTRNMKLEVLTFYLQVLLSNELLKLNREHLRYTEKQESRIARLIEIGNAVETDLIEIRSQKAQDKLTILKTENEKKIGMLRLKQVMQVPVSTRFNIDTSYSAILSDTLAFRSIETMPELLQNQNELEVALMNERGSHAGYFPSLSLSAGIGTNYSDSYFVQDPEDPTNIFVPQFNNQIDQNLYQTIAFQLSIPLYSQHQNRASVQRAEIQIERASLQLETTRRELLNTIEQLNIDISNAKAELELSMELMAIATLDFSNTERKYEQGVINYTDFLAKKDILYQSQSNLVISKYNYYFKTRIKALYYE